MLEKFNKFCEDLKHSLINEESENGDGFSNSDDIVKIVSEKLTFDDFKNDNDLIKKFESTDKEVFKNALDKIYDASLETNKQDKVLNQIYHYLKEFENNE